MENLSEYIQCVGSDTRLPMLDRSDFESWQQCIRLYCMGKENGENILQSIDECPFKMGKFKETLTDGAKGALHLGPERERVVADLTPVEKERYKADIRATNILLKGLPKDIYTLINHYTDTKDIWDNVKMLLEGSELTKDERQSQLYDDFEHFRQNKEETIHEYYQHEAHANENKMMLERYNQHAIDPLAFGRQNRGQGNNARGAVTAGNGGFLTELGMQILDKMLLMQAQENGVVLDEEQFLFIAVGPSNDSDILSEVQDHDNYLDGVGEYHEVHELQKDVQPNYIVDSDAEYTNDSNIIPYDQYAAQCVSINVHNKVVNESLTTELARYKEQVQIYEKRERFKLTKREQKIYEQMRIITTDRNIKEESLKKELHSVKMQLNFTINHNKLMKDEVATLKKDFRQKENKYLEDFLDMKALKEKVEDKLFKQDQSLQTVNILCKPKPFYDEKKKVAIGYKIPLYLPNVMQVQSALYNGHEIVKTNHAPVVVHDLEDTLEIAEKTRKKMLEKMKIPLCVEKRVKIAPPDYSKENYLATFTPQRHLTREQIFWSSNILILKPILEITVYPPNPPAKLVPRVLPTKNQTGKGVLNKQRNVTLLR
ncbi:hypothetical protein Tco_0051512 [Tanacetum coccineum]